MTESEKIRISGIVQILSQLDEKDLLLINSGAKLLAARQDLEKRGTGLGGEQKIGYRD